MSTSEATNDSGISLESLSFLILSLVGTAKETLANIEPLFASPLSHVEYSADCHMGSYLVDFLENH
jgi:hypothetical protein